MTKCEVARQRFSEGFHCSQAVLEAFAKDYGLDPVTARKMATPLAGGSGLGGECGAVAGAFLVLGLEYGMSLPNDLEAFQRVFGKVFAFTEKFKSLHGDVNCRQLIGLNVFNEADLKQFIEKNIKLTQCIKYVEDAVRILEEMIAENRA